MAYNMLNWAVSDCVNAMLRIEKFNKFYRKYPDNVRIVRMMARAANEIADCYPVVFNSMSPELDSTPRLVKK